MCWSAFKQSIASETPDLCGSEPDQFPCNQTLMPPAEHERSTERSKQLIQKRRQKPSAIKNETFFFSLSDPFFVLLF